MAISLWKLPQEQSVQGPVQLMRSQGELLSEATNGKLQTNIQTSGNAGDLVNDFNIVVPSLGYYTFTVARYVQKATAIYPGRFYSPLANEWEDIANEAAFRAALSRTLGSDAASDLVTTLMSQVS